MAIVAPILKIDIAKIGHNLKYDAMMAPNRKGVVTKSRAYDTILASYLINRINPITALRMFFEYLSRRKRHLQRF